MARQAPNERMRTPPRQVHVLGHPGGVNACQQSRQLWRVMRLDACLAACLKKGLKPFVLEPPNHDPLHSVTFHHSMRPNQGTMRSAGAAHSVR